MSSRDQVIAAIACFLTAGSLAVAQGTGEEGSRSPKLISSGTASAVRLAIANGVIEFVNNARRATIDLSWDLMPDDPGLRRDTAAFLAGKVTFTVPNDELGDPAKWTRRVRRDEDRDLLERALYIPERVGLEGFAKSESNANFRDYWNKPSEEPGSGLALLMDGVVRPSQYFAAIRDHHLITYLLASKGVTCSVFVDGARVAGGSPVTKSGNEILWDITAYRFSVGSGEADVYYRFTARARVKRFSLLFPDRAEPAATIRTVFAFRNRPPGDFQPDFESAGVQIELPPASSEQLERIQEGPPTELETILDFVGGVQLGDIVMQGLFPGTAETSVVSGGLVGEGKVQRVVGVNTELLHTSGATFGVLFGVLFDSQNSLFLGPSIQFSILTLAVGIRAFESSSGDPDDVSIAGRFAGVISIDLSRLTRSKSQVTKLALSESIAGGGWGKSADALGSEHTLLYWSFHDESGDPEPGAVTFRLVQIKDAEGNEISDPAHRATLAFALQQADAKEVTRFVPKGTYRYELGGIPAGYELWIGALRKAEEGVEVQLVDDALIEAYWVLRRTGAAGR